MPCYCCFRKNRDKTESDEVCRLDYRHCTLYSVPSEVFTFERTLEELLLDSNQICDLPRTLFHCHELKRLGLSDNEIQLLPPAIASLINLEHLDVSKNAVSEFPENIRCCKKLCSLEASVNPLGKLPEGLTQLISLEEIYLNDTFLEFLPANFGRLVKLRILELRENHLTLLPKSMSRLVSLQRLDIGQNDFATLPDVIGDFVNLTELWCDCNRIKIVPKTINQLKKMKYFDASNNCLSSLPLELQDCTALIDLTLTCNDLQSIPITIGSLKHLTTLKLDDNQIEELPNSIGHLTMLEELYLSINRLTALPQSIGLLRKLQVLLVDDNKLETFPVEVGSCVSLTILSVRGNYLTNIPAEIGHVKNLRVINVSDNRLRNLPVSIMNLSELSALWLSDNQSKPLVPLQQEMDAESGQWVLTCYIFPQVPKEKKTPSSELLASPLEGEVRINHRDSQIKFANDAFGHDSESRPLSLSRVPTPYPKELKALAKHVQNMKKVDFVKQPEVEDLSPGSEDEVEPTHSSPTTSDAASNVKVSKVTKTVPLASPIVTEQEPLLATEHTKNGPHNGIHKKPNSLHVNDMITLNNSDDKPVSPQLEETSLQVFSTTRGTVVGNRPIIKEAKCVKNPTTPIAMSPTNNNSPNHPEIVRVSASVVEIKKFSPVVTTRTKSLDPTYQPPTTIFSNKTPPTDQPKIRQPPPYHIAAIHSKHALRHPMTSPTSGNFEPPQVVESTIQQSLKEYL